MKSRIPATLVGMLACGASLAARPTLPVDSAATASRALSVALALQDTVRYPLESMIDGARGLRCEVSRSSMPARRQRQRCRA